jgi:hypothetical protein
MGTGTGIQCCGSETFCHGSTFVSDPDQTFKSSGSGSKSEPKYLLFLQNNDLKSFFKHTCTLHDLYYINAGIRRSIILL